MIPYRRVNAPHEPTGRVWPNGEFTIGYAPAGGAEAELTMGEYLEEVLSPLGLSLDSNSHSHIDEGAPKRGTKGLTSYGKRVLRNSVWRLQRLYGKRSLSFVTLTLPSVSYEEGWYVSSNWSRIVRVFYQKLSRKLEALGLPGHYASCTELQPERSEDEGHPALHLHFVCVGRWRSRGAWALKPTDFREMWKSVLGEYLDGDRDWAACENVQMVKKDVAAYMAKYLSKGISLDNPPRSDGTGWSLPTAWYNVSLSLRQWVLGNVRKDSRLIESIEVAARNGQLESGCDYFFAGDIEEMPGTGPHYFVGKMKGSTYKFFVEMWRGIV